MEHVFIAVTILPY